MAASDYYKVLGVDAEASVDTIKKAYRRLAKEYHPDTHPGDSNAERKFKEISEAYSVLGDSKKRQQYDQLRRFGFAGAGPGMAYDTKGFDFDLGDLFQDREAGSRTSRSGGTRGFNLDDLFDFGGFGDLFSQMFDRQNGFGQDANRSRKGTDIHASLEIPFEKAVLGGKTVFSINKDASCDSCRGSGSRDGKSPALCSECKGSGRLSRSQGLFAVNRPCPRCLGRGRVIKEPCMSCQGSGVVKTKRKYSINIEPGTDDGKKVRLKGQGHVAGQGTRRGDLVLTIKVSKHRFFRADGLNVFCEVPLEKERARKGTKIRVKTVHGKTVEIKVPPQTTGKKTFRLKGMGIKNQKRTGDQYVEVKVQE